MQRLILRTSQSPGDVLMLTAAVRDLHVAHPGQFVTDVRTPCDELWQHNPWITSLREEDRDVRVIDMHYPLIHESNSRPLHFIHGFPLFLEQKLGVRIPVTQFRGDIHLADDEKELPQKFRLQTGRPFWIIVAGGKFDFTAKWWNPASYQSVVNHFCDEIQFVQCGEAGHWHPPLRNVTNLVGKTSLRDFVRLMYHADGVICPVTLAMHLAAAVEVKPGRPPARACVVIAGGREPTHWEAYPQHQYISTQGMLHCCADGGCWKSRCQKVGDGDSKDRRDLCVEPVAVAADLVIPRCLHMITADDVIRRVALYLDGQRIEPRQAGHPTRIYYAKPGPVEEWAASDQRVVGVRVDGRPEHLVPTGIVCSHLRQYYPDLRIQLIGTEAQEWSKLLGLPGSPQTADDTTFFTRTVSLNGHHEIRLTNSNWPNTTAVRWLLEELRVTPLEERLHIRFEVAEDAGSEVRNRLLRELELPDSAGQRLPLAVLLELPKQELSDELRAFSQRIASENGLRVSELRLPRSGDHTHGFLQICNGKAQQQFEVTSLTEAVGILQQARVVVCLNSELAGMAAAVATPVICLWTEELPFDSVEPSAFAIHLMRPQHERNTVLAEAKKQLLKKYRIRPFSSLGEEFTRSFRGCVQLSRTSEDRSSPVRTIEPDDGRSNQAGAAIGEDSGAHTSEMVEPLRIKSAASRTSVRFFHGLGDAANFARLIPLYLRRGHQVAVECTPDKEVLFRAAGAEIVNHADVEHCWAYPPKDVHPGHGHEHQGSKSGWNISEPPLPDIGGKAERWPEYCQSQVNVAGQIPEGERQFIRKWLRDLPRPIVLLHTKGNTGQSVKSLPDGVSEVLYRELLDRFDGSIILLDWDRRVPRLSTYRMRHLTDISGGCHTERMFALMEAADLMIGVDSGPLHASALTPVRRVGIWMPGHYPARYALPDTGLLNLVLEEPTRSWNRFRRVPWNIAEQPGSEWDAAWIAKQCVRMLEEPRYLSRQLAGADAQLQHWVFDLCRGNRFNLAAAYTDRNRSLDVLLRESTARFKNPTVVETGTIRAEEDWAGAGFFTYLIGSYLSHRGGKLHSVDVTPAHCDFARRWTKVFGETVQIHIDDSIAWLRRFNSPIDVLYLDSLDTTEPGHAEHALHEVQAAVDCLHQKSLIVFDDTPWFEGAFIGKGAQAVPWLLKHGWTILYAGYQVLLARNAT